MRYKDTRYTLSKWLIKVLLFLLYKLLMRFWSFRKRPPFIVSQYGPLLMRAHFCKQPTLFTTTFSNFRGGRLRELQLYLKSLVWVLWNKPVTTWGPNCIYCVSSSFLALFFCLFVCLFIDLVSFALDILWLRLSPYCLILISRSRDCYWTSGTRCWGCSTTWKNVSTTTLIRAFNRLILC